MRVEDSMVGRAWPVTFGLFEDGEESEDEAGEGEHLGDGHAHQPANHVCFNCLDFNVEFSFGHAEILFGD